ncbi:MAG: hypothetical protein PHO23_00990 [Candidatus Pacebacteria bacterium]|nr:hypothetical protein [Candidatus Paceibacterota bacterium]
MEFKDLPQNIQDYLMSDHFILGLRDIADKSNMIAKEYYYDYMTMVAQIVCGYFTLNELFVFLQERYGIEESMAKGMTQEIYSRLLFPIKDDILNLRKKYLDQGSEMSMEGIKDVISKSQELKASMENNDSKINKLLNKE